MTRIITLLFLLSLGNCSQAQIVHEFDTLTYGDRINSTIDSVDISGSDLPTAFDGGYSILSPKGLSTQTLFNQYTELNFTHLGNWQSMEFSALPHLGFSYSFGGQGSQYLNAKYNHAFTKNTILNLYYKRNSGEGVIRNGGFTNNDVKLQFQHKGLRYSAQVKGEFVSHDLSHSAGTDSLSFVDSLALIETFGLEFSTVNKSDAHSKSKIGQAVLMNYLNVLPDSSNSLGVMTNHHYSILNREYTESGALDLIYNNIYIDSLNTRDQFNLARITNGAGVYFANSKFYVHGLIDYTYWKYQNLGANYDSTEVDLTSHAKLSLRKLVITNDLKLNLLGRFNELSERVQLDYRGDKLKAGGALLYENLSPTVQQRRYFSNTSNYLLSPIEKQNWFRVNGYVGYGFNDNKITISALGDFTSISNVYYFNGDDWNNDSLTANFASVGVNSTMQFGVFNFHPRLVYSVDQNGYLPSFQAYGRVYVKGKLFKAKKLEALAGVDFSYLTSFKTRAFIPTMDTYDWYATTGSYTPTTNLHAFVSFGIAEFRFFIRYENIGYFWSDKTNQEVSSYPVAGTRMRIGITWDFFN
jgi:hypothetical protein